MIAQVVRPYIVDSSLFSAYKAAAFSSSVFGYAASCSIGSWY